MIRTLLISLLLFTFFTSAAFGQIDSLRPRIDRILASKNAHVGVAVSIFVSDSKENDKTNEKIISDIAKLSWDYFVSKNH